MQVNDRVVVAEVGRDVSREMKGLIGRVVGKSADTYWDVKVDNTPEHGQYAGRTLLFAPEELRPVEWARSVNPEAFLVGQRVRVMAKGSPVKGKYGTVTYVKRDRIEVTIGSKLGRVAGWFQARELEVLA